MSKYGSVTSKQMPTTKVNNIILGKNELINFNYKTFSSTTQSISYDNTVDFKVSLNSVTSSNATLTLQGPRRHVVKVDLKGELHIHFPDGLYTYSAIDLGGNTSSGTFSVPTTATVSIPATSGSLIQSWYDALSVKPSAGLWADLNTLVNGLNSDGDWTEADFIVISAGMGTQEQSLRPLKTTGNSVMTFDGSDITWSVNGFVDPTQNFSTGINSGWNPSVNKVKYALNSAFAGLYGVVNDASTQTSAYSGIQDNGGRYLLHQVNATNTTTVTFESISAINYDIGLGVSKNNFSTGQKQFFASMKKPAGFYVFKLNNVSSTSNFATTNGIPNGPMYVYGQYQNGFGLATGADFIFRAYIAGSSLIDHDRVAARFNTFFAARGLSISNY